MDTLTFQIIFRNWYKRHQNYFFLRSLKSIKDYIIMDNKKDTFYKTNGLIARQNDSSMSDFASTKDEQNVLNKENKQTDNFINDFNIVLNKKVEKLVTALYMVTSFLSDKEPIKWSLRDRNISLLSGISSATKESGSEKEVENIFVGYCGVISEIISMLEVASVSKIISEMNSEILKREYASLKDIIESSNNIEQKAGKFIFPENFFLDTLPPSAEPGEKLVKDTLNEKDSIAEMMSFRNTKKEDVSQNTTEVKSLHKLSHSPHRLTPDKHSRDLISNSKKENLSRKNAILKLFKKKKELTIKDISSDVFGCSEKTIQRELLTLVSSGVLDKKGERRWTKYYLN